MLNDFSVTEYKEKSKIIIYSLSHPITDLVFYIGQTNDFLKRKYAHFNNSSGIKHAVINGILKSGEIPIMEELDFYYSENGDLAKAYMLEEYWIHQMIAWGMPLLNIHLRPGSKDDFKKRKSRQKTTIKESQSIVDWINTHPEFKWSAMCKKLDIDKGNFQRSIKATPPNIKQEFISKIEKFLTDYGYN